jgi:hypothetical protein
MKSMLPKQKTTTAIAAELANKRLTSDSVGAILYIIRDWENSMKSTYQINLQNRATNPKTVQASTRQDAIRMATALFGNKKVSVIKIH